jgi:cellulose synthase/poly-beta-1,6-N-acetylglucosamine synthase-like glycosyltransferase
LFSWILLCVYLFAASILAIYGFNTCLVAFLYWRKRTSTLAQPPLTHTPRVTVQLPIFDELYVVERLIDAAAGLEWPRDRLQIQVLDDSEDETTAIAQARVDHFRRRGIDIELVHRTDRSGFKAGALAGGLQSATGEFLVIFDADFAPPVDFLKRTIPYFARPGVGLVQARWGHLNSTYSALTRAQSIALDGHFVVEQTARSRNGLFFNFNGTAGVWRRECIEQSGGWQGDTLSEDLDLSYRAQLSGWEMVFLPEVVAPAEIPPQIHAFKRQQFRWAKGSTQCLVKLAPRILTAPNTSLFKRVEGILHLSGYMMNPMILLMVLALVPLIALGVQFPAFVTYFGLAMVGPIVVYALGQRALYPDWVARYGYFAILLLLGTGIALNNSIAVVEALTRRGSKFRRTPKFSVEADGDAWSTKRYTLPFGWESVGELAMSAYAFAGVALAWQHHLWWSMPFMVLYAAGFGFTAALSLVHSLPARRHAVELAAAHS